MKKFLLLVLLALVGCCSASDSTSTNEGQLVKKMDIMSLKFATDLVDKLSK